MILFKCFLTFHNFFEYSRWFLSFSKSLRVLLFRCLIFKVRCCFVLDFCSQSLSTAWVWLYIIFCFLSTPFQNFFKKILFFSVDQSSVLYYHRCFFDSFAIISNTALFVNTFFNIILLFYKIITLKILPFSAWQTFFVVYNM